MLLLYRQTDVKLSLLLKPEILKKLVAFMWQIAKKSVRGLQFLLLKHNGQKLDYVAIKKIHILVLSAPQKMA